MSPPGRQSRPADHGPAQVAEKAHTNTDTASVPQPGTPAEPPFQVMPPLSIDEYAALRDDIAERGVLVPVVLDQHGHTLDGHHRREIAAELGIDYPTEVHQVRDDDQARDVALALNLARRHLSREHRRALIRAEVGARPGDSDRAIARRLGCSPSTVAAVRRPEVEVSKLDTEPVSRERAEELTEKIRASLEEIDEGMVQWLRAGRDPMVLVGMLMEGLQIMSAAAGHDPEFVDPIRRHIIEPRVRAVLGVAS